MITRGTRLIPAVTALALTLALTLVACGDGGGSSDKTYRIRISHHLAASDAYGGMAELLAEQLEERSGGRLQTEVFHGGALVGPVEVLAAVGDGRVEIGYVQAGYHPAELPLLNISSIPLLGTSNSEVLLRAMNKLANENELLRAEFEAQNVLPIADIAVTDAVLVGQQRFDSLDDFNGKTIRALGYHAMAFEAVGATPVAIGFPDIYESLERGVVDAANSITLTAVAGSSFYEQSDVLQNTGMGVMGGGYWVINRDLWESFDDELKDVFLAVQTDILDDLITIMEEAEEQACEIIVADNQDIFTVDEAMVQQWRDLVLDDVVAAWRSDAAKYGGYSDQELDQFLNDYKAALDAFEGKVDYVDGLQLCAQRS